MLTEAQMAINALRLLFDLYKLRRDAATGKTGPDVVRAEKESEQAAEPNPERLKELIQELQQEESTAPLSIAIERKFPPAEAARVKQDLAAISLLASPPTLADYDYYGLISTYVRTIRDLAVRTELFTLRGWKNPHGIRILAFPNTNRALAPIDVVEDGVYRYGEVAQVSITKTECFLTDEQGDVPMTLLVEADFIHYSYGLGSEQRDRHGEVYRFSVGQERNWLDFGPARGTTLSVGFRAFGYRLKAAEVKAIISAMKEDLMAYVREVEEEQPTLIEIREELAALLKITSPRTKS